MAADTDWNWGSGETVRASSNHLVALLSGRTLPTPSGSPRATVRYRG